MAGDLRFYLTLQLLALRNLTVCIWGWVTISVIVTVFPYLGLGQRFLDCFGLIFLSI